MINTTLLDKIVRIFFIYTPIELILSCKINGSKFSEERFSELLRCYFQEYSDTEARMISQYHMKRTKGQNVLFTLVKISCELLIVRGNQVRCKYETLLRWRKISKELGEDLLICAFLANDRKRTGRKWNDFTWNIVLEHDNKQLNAIMHEGISDNHFHLFGSAPVFPMIWLRLMNDVRHGKYLLGLRQIDKERRHFIYDVSGIKEHYSAETMILQAALMRAIMYCVLQNKNILKTEEICEYLQVLKLGNHIIHWRGEIERLIEKLRLRTLQIDGLMLADYTLFGYQEPEEYSNWLFSGERKLIYDMLCDILISRKLPQSIHQLLYPYLVIRTWFRKELVQSNETIGFENFSVYNKRKNYFLSTNATIAQQRAYWAKKEIYQNLVWMVQHAVLESFQSENLSFLEIRIRPTDDFASNVKQIEFYDKLLCEKRLSNKRPWEDGDKRKILSRDQFFYVYDFSKTQDRFSGRGKQQVHLQECRQKVLRSKLEKQSRLIMKMRRLRPQIACRVRGIDACAQEIGCRPEVFACIFRTLKRDVTPMMEWYTKKNPAGWQDSKDVLNFKNVYQKVITPQLAVTYHAGEDFLDPVDGLRALDEALVFLSMGSGDRFGHATVLGLDLKKWYDRKDYCIHLNAQDYLDNVMWFYMMISEFQMEDCDLLKEFLHKEFSQTFYEIYKGREVESISIYDYYESWKLRGDSPELYRSGKYVALEASLNNPGNVFSTIRDEQGRRDDEIANLYYLYHFDRDVRRRGMEVKEVLLPEFYVNGACRLQEAMRTKIAQKGIAIEVNPSSNLFISTMDNYAEHPILKLYTLGLDSNRNINTSQMFVSINTDDKGVFHTSLENEYALLAASVENLTDSNGNKIFTPQEVYEWINRIRIMGNHQVF